MSEPIDTAAARESVAGLENLCREYMHWGIRHLQRNCDLDIECEEHDQGDHVSMRFCPMPDRYDGKRIAEALAMVPAMADEIDRLRAVLRQIVDHEPQYEFASVDNDDCAECRLARERAWPPSRLCDIHYRELSNRQRRDEQVRSMQHVEMRRIARDALDGEATDAR